MKTSEELFSQVTTDADSALLSVRAGLDASDALERTSVILDEVESSLRGLAMNAEALGDTGEAGIYRCLARELETAKALTDSVVGAMMQAR